MTFRRGIFTTLALTIATGLLLTACSSSTDGDDDATQNTSLNITTPSGTDITMPAEPQNALGFYSTDFDLLLTLGIATADTQPIRDGVDKFPDFFPIDVDRDLTTYPSYPDYDLEATASADPDFILNGLGFKDDLDEQLQTIAPTYTFDSFADEDWRDSAEKVASDLDRTEQWQAWEEGYNDRINDLKATIAEMDDAPTVVAAGVFQGKVDTACHGVPCLVFKDLGLDISEAMDPEDGISINDADGLSMEELGRLSDADIAFTWANADGSVPLTEDEALSSDNLWQSLPFVEDGNIVEYDREMLYGSPSAQDAFLTVVEEALANYA